MEPTPLNMEMKLERARITKRYSNVIMQGQFPQFFWSDKTVFLIVALF
jgi:hypothetical protein